jgi:enoyl-CoA hydratase/carnithine racemase
MSISLAAEDLCLTQSAVSRQIQAVEESLGTPQCRKYEVADNILTITLNRPGKLNAFTGAMMLELIDAFDKADADNKMRAIIVTGAGSAYCAGDDISSGVSRRQHT